MSDARNEYREMAEEIRLGEEAGMELLKKASKRVVSHRNRVKKTITAAFLAVMILVGMGSGIAYAATGQAPWNILKRMFWNSDDEYVKMLGSEFQESGESIVVDNWKITLERYWYDKTKGVLMAEIVCETTDGEPLEDPEMVELIEEKGFDRKDFYGIQFRLFESYVGRLVCEDLGQNKRRYFLTEYADSNQNAYKEEDVLTVYINKGLKNLEMQAFPLEETGQLKTRTLNASVIKNCSKAELSAMYFQIIMEEKVDPAEVFYSTWEMHMKDGTVYKYENHHTGTEYNPELRYFSVRNWEIKTEDGRKDGYRMFLDDRLIHVDKVEKIIWNGVEIPFMD